MPRPTAFGIALFRRESRSRTVLMERNGVRPPGSVRTVWGPIFRAVPQSMEVRPMTTEKLTLYDTTLRDGQQTRASVLDRRKLLIAAPSTNWVWTMSRGWPGANPTDSEFFARRPRTEHSRITAFGMTKRSGRSASNDDVLANVLNAGTESVCLVGKAHDFHVTSALRVPLSENVENIAQSISHLVEMGREAIFDAEHFFDGYRSDREYSLECLAAAHDAGARWIVLCDTNGGTLPSVIGDITAEVIASGIPGCRLGIHTHDDTGTAVAGTLRGGLQGHGRLQGTLNGLGERCGNANLVYDHSDPPAQGALQIEFETRCTRWIGKPQKVSRCRRHSHRGRTSRPIHWIIGLVHKAGLHAPRSSGTRAPMNMWNPDLSATKGSYRCPTRPEGQIWWSG